MAAPAPPISSRSTTAEGGGRGHIGLVVLGSIASGLVLGLVLVLAVFDGGEEAKITGSALMALGAGFTLLAIGSSRFTDQPQRWALAPAVVLLIVGLAVLVFLPGDRTLRLAGWVWPALLLLLVVGHSAARAGRSTTGHAEGSSTRPSLSCCSLRSAAPPRRLRRQRGAIRHQPVGAPISSMGTVST
jgi:hypothetical protein